MSKTKARKRKERARARHIEQGWQSYIQAVSAPNVMDPNSVQYREMRKAYYAGATILFNSLLGGVSPSPEDVFEQSDQHLMEDIQHELDLWLFRIRTGQV